MEDLKETENKVIQSIPVPIELLLKTLAPIKGGKDKIDLLLKFYERKIKGFTPKVQLYFEKSPYLVKTAETPKEFEEVLRLRYEVFQREFRGKKIPIGLDLDRYDFLCDHLIIVDQKTGKIVGTYRLNSSQHSNRFYSQDEFQMEALLGLSGDKVELGRASIHKDYRTGMVMHLLWRGIVEYLRLTGIRILFGCASVQDMDPLRMSLLYKVIEESGHLSQTRCLPTENYAFPGFEEGLGLLKNLTIQDARILMKQLMSPLFLAYLKAGTKVLGPPALDRPYRCVDFLVCLNLDDLPPSYERRYGL